MNKAPRKSKCQRCDLGYIIQDHITALMQLLTNDIPEMNFRLQTTKCLNTAVMLLFFIVGSKRALKMAQSCDTHTVITRHKNGLDNNIEVLQELKKQMFSATEKSRTIYYVLLTDGYFPAADLTKGTVYFPGHVFILEKLWDEERKEHYFYFYQSYINQYTLKGHIEKNNGFAISSGRAKELYKDVEQVLTSDRWDEKSMMKWFDLTFATTQHFANSTSRQNFFICFRKAKTNICLKNINIYLQQKLRQLKTIKDKEAIYGDTSLYLDKTMALTTNEMLVDIQTLLKKVQSKINLTTKAQ